MRGRERRNQLAARIVLIFVALLAPAAFAQSSGSADASLRQILAYIHSGWDSLTRSTTSCSGITDPKLSTTPVFYLPGNIQEPAEVQIMRHQCHVDVERLPTIANHLDASHLESIQPPGLLYLPNKYVVPGGRFNEMYGWDSYFIILGPLRDGRVELARGMVENFFFEIEYYGAVLNANRTYYLSRSQPPFLSSMIMAVHKAQVAAHKNDQGWMERAYSYAKRDYAMWTQEPHLAGSTGLSRYYDLGEGPAIEALQDEAGTYRQVAAYFLLHPVVPNFTVPASDVRARQNLGQPYELQVCAGQVPKDCGPVYRIRLTPDYYKGDRSMRESGFDISFRFGAYGAATHHYAPVCLNSLLIKTEQDLETLARLAGKNDEAQNWHDQSEARKQAIQKYLWDEQQGLFFDYQFDQNQRSTYRFATTFYPLWAGVATAAQARAVMANLPKFEMPGGIVTSLEKSEGQWDYPYGWAPLQLLAIEGMRRYGYNPEANRISAEFLSMVLKNFLRDGTIREKYNVVTSSSETHVAAGYPANVIGFGWTNGVFLELFNAIPLDERNRISGTALAAGVRP